MGDHDITPTCLSAEEHGQGGVSDKILHYLGCLESCEREDYFEELDKEHQGQIESELRRINYLRHILGQDAEDLWLIFNLEKSVNKWKSCDSFKGEYGINAVQKWRSDQKRPTKQQQRDPRKSPSTISTAYSYDPDRDLNAYFIRYPQSESTTDLHGHGFNGHFPNHKIAVSELLDEKKQPNPMARDSYPDQSINYFHLPANNMHVSISVPPTHPEPSTSRQLTLHFTVD